MKAKEKLLAVIVFIFLLACFACGEGNKKRGDLEKRDSNIVAETIKEPIITELSEVVNDSKSGPTIETVIVSESESETEPELDTSADTEAGMSELECELALTAPIIESSSDPKPEPDPKPDPKPNTPIVVADESLSELDPPIEDSTDDVVGDDDVVVDVVVQDSWPMFGNNPRHTGQSPYAGPESLDNKAWELVEGYAFACQPVIDNEGTIYVQSLDSWYVSAIKPNGQEKWRFETDALKRTIFPVSSLAIGNNETIYVNSSFGILYALDKENGNKKWDLALLDYNTQETPSKSLTIAENGTVLAAAGNYLFAVSENGDIVWKLPMPLRDISSPAIGLDGTVYVASGHNDEEGKLIAVNSEGSIKWEFNAHIKVFSFPCVGSDAVYFGCGKWFLEKDRWVGSLFAVNPDGTEKWKFEPDSMDLFRTLAAGDDVIYCGGRNLYAVNLDGTKKWKVDFEDGYINNISLDNKGYIYVATTSNGFNILNPNGDIISTDFKDVSSNTVVIGPWAEVSNETYSSSIGKDGTLFLTLLEGKVVCYKQKGQPIWYYQDADNDGYGNLDEFVLAESRPDGYVLDKSDCDDNNRDIYPGAMEICNDIIDNNCNGAVDENCDAFGSQPWAVILCKFSDIDEEPFELVVFEDMLKDEYGRLGSIWKEISYNNMDLEGSKVFGWITLPNLYSYYCNPSGYDISKLISGAMDTANIDFSGFAGIAVVFNHPETDNYLWKGGYYKQWKAVWVPVSKNSKLDVGVWSHEMGHSYGLDHSCGDEKENVWDFMCTLELCDESDSSYNSIYSCPPLHTIAHQKRKLGWIKESEVVKVDTGVEIEIELERLALPQTNNPKMAVVYINGSRDDYYTVEARKKAGYDMAIPCEAVVIHKVEDDSIRVVSDADSMWMPGESFVENGVEIIVNSETPTGFNVTIMNNP